jgi:hypothetical protein
MPPKESSKLKSLEVFSSSVTDSGKRLRLIADRIGGAVNRYRYVLLALLSIGYFYDAYVRASRKLFWFDEIFTLYISRLPDLRSLWHVLMAGFEFNPPLLYILTGFSNRLLGENPVSARLPEIISFWIFCLCLFRFVSVRSTALAGFISMLFPMVTLAHWYAYEARPYALELGFCGIALVCWQSAADHPSKRLWQLLGLGAALAGVLLTHGYAFLVFAPIVMGELARTAGRGRVDWPVWVTIAISSGALIVLVPQSLALRSVVIPATVTHASLAGLVTNYISYLKPAAYVGFGWLILMCVVRTKAHTPTPIPAGQPRLYETVALLVFLAIPALQCLVAWLTGAPPIARYSICWIAGPAALLGIASARRPVVAIGTLVLLVAQIGANELKFRSSQVLIEPSVGYPISTSLSEFRERYRWMEAGDKTLPIALLDSFDFLPTAFYAPPDLLSRMSYVKPSRSDLVGIFYSGLRTWCHAVLDSPVYLGDFVAAHDTFLAYGGPSNFSLLNDFRKAGAIITVQNITPDHFLVCVKYPGKPANIARGQGFDGFNLLCRN